MIIEFKNQQVDYKLAIAKDADGTPGGWLIPDKLGQIPQGIPEGKALCFIVGAPGAIVLCTLSFSHYRFF